jgi:hypothetical protein
MQMASNRQPRGNPQDGRPTLYAPGAIETDFAGGSVRDNKQVNDFIASVTALGETQSRRS